MNRNTYLNRDPDFDGLIVYHNLDGTFSNGWKYVKGNIVTSLIECTECADMISWRAVPASYEVLQSPATRSGGEAIDGGELPGIVIIGNSGGSSGGGYGGGYTGGGSGGGGGGGYTGGSTGGSSPPPTVVLYRSKTVTLMDSYYLNVTASNGTITNVTFVIINNSQQQSQQWTIQNGANLSRNMQAIKPGTWEIKALATMYANGSTVQIHSNTITVTVQYPDINTVKGNSTVSANMSTVWMQTKNAASSSGRSERGFWILANTSTMQYECGTTIVGANVTGCAETHASVPPGTPGEVIRSSPLTGGKYAVAFFHTHTPLSYCPIGVRAVGPSPTDNSWASSTNMPCLLYDYTGTNVNNGTNMITGITGGHRINDAAQIYSFGPSRRPTPTLF
jgi:hypothetical protein